MRCYKQRPPLRGTHCSRGSVRTSNGWLFSSGPLRTGSRLGLLAPLSRHSVARAPPFGPRATPRLRLRPRISAAYVAHHATRSSLCTGPASLRLTQLPPTPLTRALLPAISPASGTACSLPPTAGSRSNARLSHKTSAPSYSRALASNRPCTLAQPRIATGRFHCRSTHPSDRAGPRGSPSLGWPGVHASVMSPPTGYAPAAPQSRTAWTALPSSRHRQFGFRRPASHSAGSAHIPVTAPPTGPAHGTAPDSNGQDGPTVVCVSSNPHMGRT